MLGTVACMRNVSTRSPKTKVCVIGAGAFGGWSALHLLRKGASVTLLDSWGPANVRASSHDETRVIRSIYGPKDIYVKMVAEAFQQWKENEKRWRTKLYQRTGVLWMVGEDDSFERSALPIVKNYGFQVQELSLSDARQKYSQINFEEVKHVFYEEEAGYLLAKNNCQTVVKKFVEEGGEYRQASVKPGKIKAKTMEYLTLSDGSQVSADFYVFACGPWLGSLFPTVIGNRVSPSRQEVFYFEVPPNGTRFYENAMPIWADHGTRFMYGIPASKDRGFKVADDTHGPSFDPNTEDRTVSPKGLKEAQQFLAYRFPALKGARLVNSHVCQYENSPDGDYIIDQHPEAENVWIVGGGSGHGFKMGPAIGRYISDLVLGVEKPNPVFSLARFKT